MRNHNPFRLLDRFCERAQEIRDTTPVSEMPTWEQAMEQARDEYLDACELKDDDKGRFY